MVMPVSRGLNAFAPIMSRQGVFGSTRPQTNIGIAPTGSLRNMPRQPMIAQPRPGPAPMPMPQQRQPMAQPNPFAGFTQTVQPQFQQLPPQPFNPYPNPTAGAGAGQMPLGKQMLSQINPQMMPQVQPMDMNQFQQPNLNPQMMPQVEPMDMNQFGQRSKFDEQMFAQPDMMAPSLFNPNMLRMK